MDATQLKERIRAITVWKRGTQRAPHKPLLLLYALGKCLRGEPRMISYVEVDRVLHDLLLEYGPERKSYHPEYPFWRLQNDGIWELSTVEDLELRRSNTDAKRSELLKHGVAGGFTVSVSQFAHGTRGFSEWLLSFHGASLRQPQDPIYAPRAEFVTWHQREVFRRPARVPPKMDVVTVTPVSPRA